MRFSYSDEQEEFRSVVRRFLEDYSSPADVRRLMGDEAGVDPEVWRKLSAELGLAGIQIPERFGGQGFGFEELCIVLQETGRALLCAPYFGSAVLATNAILEAGSESDHAEWLPPLASGAKTATLALSEPRPDGGGWDADAVSLVATPLDGELRSRAPAPQFQLEGTKTHVLDGHRADLLIVVARTPGSTGQQGVGFFVVEAGASGVERKRLSTLDETRKLAQVRFAATPARALGAPGEGAPALARVLDLGAIALASEMVGGAQKVLEDAVAYAKTRMQFGRPIGSFQAIKHKCADMLLEVELAKSAAAYAAAGVDEDDPEVPVLACLAKAMAADAYRNAAAESIQIHGGVGFTWEHDMHLYFKRAKGSEVLLGDPAYHREAMAARMEI